jgi:hypothetical protein
MALNAVNVSCTVRRASCALAFPHHLAQAVHGFMVRVVKRVALGCQKLNRLPNAARLVNGALLADRQMHRQVQKRVGFTAFNVVHFFKCSVGICNIGVVFGVFLQPLTGQGFNRFHRLTGSGFCVNSAKKTPDIGLGRREHSLRISRVASGFGFTKNTQMRVLKI